MAKVEYSDLFNDNLDDQIRELNKELLALDKIVKDLAKVFKAPKAAIDALVVSLDKATASTIAGKKAIKDSSAATMELAARQAQAKKDTDAWTQATRDMAKVSKIAELNSKRLKSAIDAQDKTTEKGQKSIVRLTKELEKHNTAVRKAIEVTKNQTIALKAELGSYNQIQAALKKNVAAYKAMSQAERETSKAGKALTSTIKQQEAQLKRLDASLGRNFRNVGNYKSALNGAKTSLIGLAAGAGLAINATQVIGKVIGDAIRGVIEFEKKNSELAGVLGRTSDEVGALTREALRLGSSTAKTAIEVTGLQIALSRLGFTEQEIINLAPAIINGSNALNAELSETATLVGAVVRTFDDFSSADAPAIVDQLTLATQKSALNFKKLQTGIPIVAGAANAAGVSFTQMTALLGKLSDAGIDASMSATSLRNIFIDSAAQGLTFAQILEKVKGSTDQLTAANDEFGRRTAVSATILANNIDQVQALEGALNRAAGTAAKTAATNLDNLAGAATLFTSAWDGLVKRVTSGDSVFGQFLINNLLNAAASFNTLFEPFNGYAMNAKLLEVGLAGVGKQAKEFTKALAESRDAEAITKALTGLNNALGISEIKLKTLEEESLKSAEGFAAYGKARLTIALINNEIEILNKALKNAAPSWEALEQGIQDAETAAEEFDNIDLDEFLNIDGLGVTKSYETMLSDLLFADEESNAKREEAHEKSLEKLADASIKAATEDDERRTKNDEKEDSEQRAKLSRNIGYAQAAFDVIGQISDSLFERQIANLDQEISALQLQRDIEIGLAEGNAEAITAINEKFDKKQRELNIEKAKKEKRAAIIQANINIAQSILGIFGAYVPPVSYILAGIAAAAGAVQLATIASQPLPEFAEGTDFAQGGASIVGEEGTEAILSPSGDLSLTPSKATVMNLDRGSKVFTAQETKDALRAFNEGARELAAPMVVSTGLTREDLDSQTKKLAEAFENQSQHITQIGSRGIETFMKYKGQKTKYYNERYN